LATIQLVIYCKNGEIKIKANKEKTTIPFWITKVEMSKIDLKQLVTLLENEKTWKETNFYKK